MSPEERGIYCVKGYGMVEFVSAGTTVGCPISGRVACVDCDVVTKEEAIKGRQVKVEEK